MCDIYRIILDAAIYKYAERYAKEDIQLSLDYTLKSGDQKITDNVIEILETLHFNLDYNYKYFNKIGD